MGQRLVGGGQLLLCFAPPGQQLQMSSLVILEPTPWVTLHRYCPPKLPVYVIGAGPVAKSRLVRLG